MRFATTEQPHAKPGRRAEPVIVFCIGLETFAIAVGAVLEIGSTDGLGGAAAEFAHPEVPKVRHTLQRGARTYYVVNACMHFHLAQFRPALVLLLSDSRAAVLVDRIERMTEITALFELPRAFSGEERGWYRGLAILNNQVVPVVNPGSFLSSREIALLDAAAGAGAAVKSAAGREVVTA